MVSETWLPIPDWDMYEISNLGRVRRNGRILKTDKLGWGEKRHTVNLCNKERRGMFVVSRLVLIAFEGPPPFAGAEARHLNDIKTDDRLSNLAWGTHKQNMEDAVKNDVYNPSRKLSIEDVTLIKTWLAAIPWRVYGKYQFIADMFNLNKIHIYKIDKGVFWEYVNVASEDVPIFNRRHVEAFLKDRFYRARFGKPHPTASFPNDLFRALVTNPQKTLGLR